MRPGPHSIMATDRPLCLTEIEYDRLETEMSGVCRACGYAHGPVEPDARGDRCPTCQAPELYGLDELLARGEVEVIV